MKPFVSVPMPLYQVQVTDTATDRQTFIGPAMTHPKALYDLAEAINKGAKTGTETRWREAHVQQLPTSRSH